MSDTNRIIRLEEEIAHLQTTNEELSSELVNQWKKIETMEKQIRNLENRFSGLEDSLDNPGEEPRPPHW